MHILHLGGNDLGDRILAWLRDHEDHVDTVTDRAGLDAVEIRNYDWAVSAGFRHIVPASVLDLVPHACNVHTSLLPWGRGGHPNVWAIVDHEPAGMSIHRMTPGVDEGPIYAQREVAVTFGDVLATCTPDSRMPPTTCSWRPGRNCARGQSSPSHSPPAGATTAGGTWTSWRTSTWTRPSRGGVLSTHCGR